MSKKKLNAGVTDEKYELITPWGYVGYGLLFAIPIVGLVLLIVFSMDENHLNRRSYARSYWCVLLLAVLTVVALIVLSVVVTDSAGMREWSEYMKAIDELRSLR